VFYFLCTTLRWLQKSKEKEKKNDASSPEEQVVSSVVAHTPVKVEKQGGVPSQLGADHFSNIRGYAKGVMGTWYALYAHIFQKFRRRQMFL